MGVHRTYIKGGKKKKNYSSIRHVHERLFFINVICTKMRQAVFFFSLFFLAIEIVRILEDLRRRKEKERQPVEFAPVYLHYFTKKKKFRFSNESLLKFLTKVTP